MAQAVKFAVHLCGIVVLSRILGPSSVGVVVVATAVIGFGEYFRDFGLSVASIREHELTDAQRDALLWTNVALGVCLAAAVFVTAAPLARGFGIPDLEGVLKWLSLTFILNGTGAQYRAGLNRDRNFRQLAIADSVAPTVGLAWGIWAALSGFGYWSLAGQFLVTAIVSNIMMVALGRWLPAWPRRAPGIGRMYRFGANYAASQVIGYAGNNLDTVALGYLASPGAAGVYGRAFQLSIGTLDQVKAPANTVAIPLLSSLRNQPRELMAALKQGQLFLSYATMPIAAIMVAGGVPVITMILGADWAESGPILSVLATAAALQQLATVASWTFVVSGNASGLRNYMAVSTGLKVVAVILTAAHGPLAVAIGYTVAVAMAWPIAIRSALRPAGLDVGPVLLQGLRLFILAAVASLLGLAAQMCVREDLLMLRSSVAVGVVVLSYAASIAIPSVRRDLRELFVGLKLAIGRSSIPSSEGLP